MVMIYDENKKEYERLVNRLNYLKVNRKILLKSLMNLKDYSLFLEIRSSKIKVFFYSDEWKSKFLWDYIISLNDNEFDMVIRKIDLLIRLLISYKSESSKLQIHAKSNIDDSKSDHNSSSNLILIKIKEHIKYARDELIDSQLQKLKKQLGDLRQPPPAALDEVHSNYLSELSKLNNIIREKQEYLKQRWSVVPEELFHLFLLTKLP